MHDFASRTWINIALNTAEFSSDFLDFFRKTLRKELHAFQSLDFTIIHVSYMFIKK